MDRPTWRRREEWGLAEMSHALDRGILPAPTVVLFEGDEATLYVRGGPRNDRPGPRDDADQRLAWNELFALGYALRPEGVLVVTPVRLRTDADGALAGEAEGEAAVGMEWARRHDGASEHGGAIVTYGLDDEGRPHWRDRQELPASGGPFTGPLAAVVTGTWPADDGEDAGREADLGMSPASLAYSLRCFGITVGVADGWSERYGFDVPVDPRLVRREDRRRAAERWRQRGRTEVRS